MSKLEKAFSGAMRAIAGYGSNLYAPEGQDVVPHGAIEALYPVSDKDAAFIVLSSHRDSRMEISLEREFRSEQNDWLLGAQGRRSGIPDWHAPGYRVAGAFPNPGVDVMWTPSDASSDAFGTPLRARGTFPSDWLTVFLEEVLTQVDASPTLGQRASELRDIFDRVRFTKLEAPNELLGTEMARVRVLETFEGFVEQIVDDTAYVTLTSQYGDTLDGKYPARELETRGIHERRRFGCKVVECGDQIRVDLEAIPDIDLSEEQLRQIQRETDEMLGDDDL